MSRKHYPKKTHDTTMKTSLPCRKDYINVSEKMASLKKVEETAMNEKVENVNLTQMPAEKTSDIKSTISKAVRTNVTPTVASTSSPPSMAQKTFQFTKKKSIVEKLKDKFQQLIHAFK